MVEFLTVFKIAHSLFAIVGCSFNLLLAYLAIFQTPRVIRSYSTLILNFAITDFLACISDFFVQQRIIPIGYTLGYISNGVCRYFGAFTCYTGFSFMLHVYSHSLWSLLLSFSYRYYILFKPAPSRKMLALLLFLIYQPSLLQFVSYLYSFDDPAQIRAILDEQFPQYNASSELAVSGTVNILCFSALYCILHMNLPITPVYICILILRRNIIRRLSFKGINITKDTKNLHAQLLMALTYQAAIPGFYLYSVFSYSVSQLGFMHHPVLEYSTFSSFLFIPTLSPIASFIFVTPYRQFIRRWFYLITNQEIGENSTSTNPIQAVAYHHRKIVGVIG